MKRFYYLLLVAVITVVPLFVSAQQTITFFGQGNMKCEKKDALTYEVAEWVDGVLVVNAFEMTGELLSEKSFADTNRTIKVGTHKNFHKNGQLASVWTYANDKPQGEATGFYKTGEPYYIKQFNDAGEKLVNRYFTLSGDEVPEEKVSRVPEFPGGEAKLLKFLGSNLKYPNLAKDAGIQGIVYAGIIVNKEGEVVDPIILRSVHPLLDEEALRVVAAMPKWSPGMEYGETVDVYYKLPFSFTLK